MSFPTDYLDPSIASECSTEDPGEDVRQEQIWNYLRDRKLVATRLEDPLPGLISRVRIDAFGKTAAEVEATLLAYAGRCDMAAERQSCSYGECVIERNLLEQWGDSYSWKGRLVIHPDIGQATSSERAKEAIDAED